MPIYRLNNFGVWKKLSALYRLNNDGNWRPLSSLYRLSNLGNWRKIFSSEVGPEISQQVEISQSTNSTTGLVTLTGTNYNWTNANSLTYFFEWYNVNTWQIIDTGSITNPTSGSSNTKTYVVQTYDTNTNTDNLYRFRVRATNISLTSNSTSGTTTISTPRNVTNVTASQVGTDLQATVSFTVGLFTNSVIIRRFKFSGGTLQSTTDYNRTTASPATIPLDEYNKQYRFAVIPYTGNLVSANVTGYPGNQSDLTAQFTSNFPPAPVQTSSPTLSSTGNVVIGTTLTATRGTYQTNTIAEGNPDIAIQTRVYGYVFPGPIVTNGTTTPPPTPAVTSGGTQSLLTTQLMVNYTFYAVDIVTSADASSTYYYYSDLTARSFLPSFSDNFNRPATTGSQGLGQTSTGSWFWSTNGGLYGPQTPTTNTDNFSWQLDTEEISGRQTAVTPRNPSTSDNASNYPLKSINVGDSNVSLRVSVADGGGGPGLAFWVTASGSWWAAAPHYTFSSTNVTTYDCGGGPFTHNSTSCPTLFPVNASNVGQACSCNPGFTSFSYDCGGGPFDAISCPAGPFATTAANVGLRCSACTPITSSTCTGSGACAGQGCCPASGSADGQRCSNCIPFNECNTQATFEVRQTSNPNGTTCGSYCSCQGPFTNAGTSTCGTVEGNFPSSTTPVISSCVTAADAEKICAARLIGVDLYAVRRCVLGTAAYTYWNCGVRVCGSTYNTNQVTTLQRYNTVREIASTTNATYNTVRAVTSTVNTYSSRVKIISAVGSAITTHVDTEVASSNTAYNQIYGISVATTANTITANAYSNLTLTNQLGSTITFNATSLNPQRSIAGDSAVGIINTPTTHNRLPGNRLDDFVYTNV